MVSFLNKGVVLVDFTFIIVIFLISFIGSYISGMLGIGGSIIKYPMLLFIPTLLGLTAAIMMFIPKESIDDTPFDQVTFNKWLAQLFLHLS